MTLDEAAAIVRPHHDKIVAESRADALLDALKLLAEPGRWDEVWQMRDFAKAVMDGQTPEQAIAQVLAL